MRTVIGLVIGTVLAQAACAGAGGPRGLQPPAWRTEPSMLRARSAHAVVSDGRSIYAVGGSGDGQRPVLAVERFDGRSWQVETTLPGQGLNAPAAVVLGGRLYVIGGFNGVSNVPTDRVLVYDPAQRRWSEAAPLPSPRGGHAAVVRDGIVHVFGGGNDRSTLADHDSYDPATDTWTRRAPLPRSLGSPAGVVVDGKVWSIGGRSGTSDYGDVHIYDPAADAWSAGPALDPRGTAGAVLYRGAILLIGGESQARRATLDDVLRLDLRAGRWELVTSLPSPRNYARAVLLHDRVYVVGAILREAPVTPRPGAAWSRASSCRARNRRTCERPRCCHRGLPSILPAA